MPSIFLCHSSIDKPFVEKLATDLKKLGIEVWFDKWKIGVGESLTWKIEAGIREHEFLGVILSPDSLASEWVKSEIGSAWAHQMRTKKIGVLPILYRDCDIPLFLNDRKYADFRSSYDSGFDDLARSLGLTETQVLEEGNWRRFAKGGQGQWQDFRDKEFGKLVQILFARAKQYKWSAHVGTKNKYSIAFDVFSSREAKMSVSVRLNPKTHAYMATYMDESNPNNIKASDYTIYVGNTINECEEFIWRQMEDFQKKYGKPEGKPWYSSGKPATLENKMAAVMSVFDHLDWLPYDQRMDGASI